MKFYLLFMQFYNQYFIEFVNAYLNRISTKKIFNKISVRIIHQISNKNDFMKLRNTAFSSNFISKLNKIRIFLFYQVSKLN